MNESLRTRPSAISGPITLPVDFVVTTLSTPSGSPAFARMSASLRIVSGVSPAGLITMVQPAAIAGPIFRVPMANGKFRA